jgi:hypothetical protein
MTAIEVEALRRNAGETIAQMNEEHEPLAHHDARPGLFF